MLAQQDLASRNNRGDQLAAEVSNGEARVGDAAQHDATDQYAAPAKAVAERVSRADMPRSDSAYIPHVEPLAQMDPISDDVSRRQSQQVPL
jgi:hypothetical protein